MRTLTLLIIILLLISCTSENASMKHNSDYQEYGEWIADKSLSAIAQNERVRFLVFHYTALNEDESLHFLTQKQVSAHYFIPERVKAIDKKPIIRQLVDETKRAWHAGVSNWNGRVNLNDTSIGVEVANPGFHEQLTGEKIWYPFNRDQINAVKKLSRHLINKYDIAPQNILAHSDIAPLRKYDPGPLFPWKELAEAGIGAWPDPLTVKKYLAGRDPSAPGNILLLQKMLKIWGYDKMPQNGQADKMTQRIISAFQMHFRPSDFSGKADAETEAIALALVEKYHGNA